MPRYDYKCTACEVVTEVTQSMKECKREMPCPECGEPANLLISRPHVYKENERVMHSMAFPKKWFEDGTVQKHFSQFDVVKDGPFARSPKVRNRAEKLSLIKKWNQVTNQSIVELD